MEMGQFTHFTSYAGKAVQSQVVLNAVSVAKLRSNAGLAHLKDKRYKLAAEVGKVIDNIDFWDFLELVPEIKKLIHNFYDSQFVSCMEFLGNVKAKLLLGIHFRDNVETLYDQIRNKALIQYTRPYVSIDLHKMAGFFNTTVAAL